MADDYFKKFPTIEYANTTCLNIMERVIITRGQKGNLPYSYYPYQIRDGDWPDVIAGNYYGDPGRSWLVYLSAGIIDPYYDWPMDNMSFQSFIVNKYGSLTGAQGLVLWWQNDWATDADEEISLSGYAALPGPLQKYYTSVFGVGSTIVAYQLRRSDWVVATNIIATLGITNAAGKFSNNEQVTLTSGNTNLSNSTLMFTNSTVAIVEHVFGNTEQTGVLTGLTSGATANVTGLIAIANSIPIDERVFWAPIYAYDYETNLNEQRKNIRLLDARYAPQISTTLGQELANNS